MNGKKSIKRVIMLLTISYIVFGFIVVWLVWSTLKQNGFTGTQLYLRLALVMVIFSLLSFVEFWLKYKVGISKTLLIRSISIGVGVLGISYIIGYELFNSAVWGVIFGIIYYFWDKSKMKRMQMLQQ